MLNPQPNYIVAKPDEGETQTKSGILLQEAQKQVSRAKVLTVGTEVSVIQPDDTVIYLPYSSTEVSVEGEDYLLIDANDVIAIING